MNNIDLTYEEAIAELDEILNDLEQNNCNLDESIKKFKKGIKLYNYCNDILSKVEGEITLLLKDDFEKIQEIEFPMEDSNELL